MGIRERVAAQKYVYAGSALVAIAFIGTGLQHFIYLQFVKTLVPTYLPLPILWAGLTGMAMIAAGVSFLMRKRVHLAAMLLSLMMVGFIVMIHVPKLSAGPRDINNWVRALQDLAILATALMLTKPKSFIKTGVLFYAVSIIALGLVHFMQPDIVTAKIPSYFPAKQVFDVAIGLLMIALALCMVTNRYAQKAALALGGLLLLFALLYSAPLLVNNLKNGAEWTTFLLSLAVAGGGFVAAGKVGK